MQSVPGVDVVACGAVEACWAEPPGTPPDPARERRVAEVSARAVAQRDAALHDSPILVFRRIERLHDVSVVHGEYVPYRYCYARRELGDMGILVDPIGVNGMTFVHEDLRRWLVLGRRSSGVTWYPGCWECVPSGGLDRRCARPDGTVDVAAMLVEEFAEELCMPAGCARIGESFGFVFDRATGTYDVCCEMEALCSRRDLLEAVSRSSEYSELLFVDANEMSSAAERLGAEMIPTGHAMVHIHGGLL